MKKKQINKQQETPQNDDKQVEIATKFDSKHSVFNRKQIRKEKKNQVKQKHITRVSNIKQKKQQQKQKLIPQVQQVIEPIPVESKKNKSVPKMVEPKPKIVKLTKLEKMIQEDENEIAKLTSKLGLKKNRLTYTQIKQDGYDDDLFDFLDHIDTVTNKKNLAEINYNKYKEIQNNIQDELEDQSDEDIEVLDHAEGFTDEEIDLMDEESADQEEEEEEEEQEEEEEEEEEVENDEIDQEEEYEEEEEEEYEEQEEKNDFQDQDQEDQQYLQEYNKKQLIKKEQQQQQQQQQNAIVNQQVKTQVDPEIEKFLKRNLNKLSEPNIDAIFAEINKIYESNSKQVVNQALAKIFISSTIELDSVQQHILSCNSVVICAVHQIYGDISFAEFIKSLVLSFKQIIDKQQNLQYIKNISLVLSNWFLLDSISLDFIKEYILHLLNNISSITIESIITIIQYCGKKIRQENPGNLKLIIDQIREKIEQSPTEDEQQKSKINFLMMTLADLKANKKQNNDPTVRLEFIINWLKKNIIAKQQLTKQTFPLGLESCIKSEFSNINWWKPVNHIIKQEKELFDDFLTNKMKMSSQKQVMLEKLAIEQKMINETRKTIFKIIMGADDIFEASQNLLRLNFLKKNRADICTVLLEVCGNEKTYNPYYCYLASQLISLERGIKSKLQFAFWDKYKLMHEFTPRRISNFANFLSMLMLKKDLNISVFKSVLWDSLNNNQKLFLQLVFWNYINKTDFENIQYQCTLGSEDENKMLKENVIHFLKNEFKQYVTKKNINESQEEVLIKMTKNLISNLND